MTKASDKLLGDLHGQLAKSMIANLNASNGAEALLEEHADLPENVVEFLEKVSCTNPAFFTAVSKFLKDNDITCLVEENDEMSELEERLKVKRKRVGNVIPMDL